MIKKQLIRLFVSLSLLCCVGEGARIEASNAQIAEKNIDYDIYDISSTMLEASDEYPVYVAALSEKTGKAGYLGTCNVVHSNNHAFIVDLGCSDREEALIKYIDLNDLIIDGISISHFHTDHIGDCDGNRTGLNALLDYLCLNPDRLLDDKLNVYLPHGGDASYHAADSPGYINWENVSSGAENRERMINFITDLDTKLGPKVNLIYPKENDRLDMNGFQIVFNNVSPSKLDYYYANSINARGIKHALNNADYNDFSMIVSVLTQGKKIVFPGDILYAAQSKNRDVVSHPDVYFVEHHGVNYVSDFDYLNNLFPELAIVQGWGTGRNVLTAYLWGRNTISKLLERGTPVIHSVEAGETLLTITSSGIAIKTANQRNRVSYNGSYTSGIGLLKGVNIDKIGDEETSIHGPGKYFIPSGADAGTNNWFGNESTLPKWVKQYLKQPYHPIQLEVLIPDEGATKKIVEILSSGSEPFYISKRIGERTATSNDHDLYTWGPWHTVSAGQSVTKLYDDSTIWGSKAFVSNVNTALSAIIRKGDMCTITLWATVTAPQNAVILTTNIPYTLSDSSGYVAGVFASIDPGSKDRFSSRVEILKIVNSKGYYALAAHGPIDNKQIYGSITFPIID